tara:strand:- start:852 stop:1271 length:420 start_codon:yes stop_codon:yes gene_type:complete
MNTDSNNIEFKIFGKTIENLSIIYGIFLIIWGVLISFLSGSNSLTSYIPSFLGFPILIFSYLSNKFISKKKMFMHIVVLFGLVVFLGGLDFIRSIIIGNIFENYWADLSKLIMLITGLFFTIQCIRSFIHARKIKETNN